MGQAGFRGLLTFSAILALGPTLAWTKPALPDRPLQHGPPERVSGKSDQAGTDSRATEASEEARKDESEGRHPGSKGKETLKPDRKATQSEAGEETPAREEKSDCDDCVIVLPETPAGSDGKAMGSSGMSGSGHLAGTLWGLFMVARPKRMPRTIIRGVTVP